MIEYPKLLLLMVMVSVQVAYSQTVSVDSSFRNQALNSSRGYLADTLTSSLKLYNGTDHPGYIRGIKGFAYLDSDEMKVGRLKYDDVWYTVPMLYDLYTEKVILTHFLLFTKISLINEKVDEFVLHDHVFKNFKAGGSKKNQPEGLNEVLYEGDSIAVFAKKRKFLNERSSPQGLEREFIANDRYYIQLKEQYHIVKSKRDLLALMGSEKKEVAAYLRKNRIKFSDNKEEALVIASKIYDKKI